MDLAQSAEYPDFGPPASEDMIQAAEQYLGLRFPPSYREFLALAGCGSFSGREFYGITPGGIEATAIPSVTFATMDERRHGLPAHFVLFEDPGTDEQYVLDTQDLSREGEAPVKVWRPASDRGSLAVVASDFGTYLLRAAEEARSA